MSEKTNTKARSHEVEEEDTESLITNYVQFSYGHKNYGKVQPFSCSPEGYHLASRAVLELHQMNSYLKVWNKLDWAESKARRARDGKPIPEELPILIFP